MVGLFGLLLMLQPGGLGAAVDDPEARKLVKAMFDETRVSFSARIKLSAQGGLVHVLVVRHAQESERSLTYMEILEPYVVKGTRFLSIDRDKGEDEHYTFVPVVRRSVRVPQWTLNHSFLGSTFYMIDINIPDLDDFTYSFVGTRDAGGRSCRQVEAVPKKPDYAYGKVVYCIADIAVSMLSEYYDTDGKLFKVWKPVKLEEIDGVWTPLDQTMENVQTESTSRLEIIDVKHNATHPPETFTKAYLER